MLLPVIDLLRVFIVRINNGKSPFEPDRNHIHHILIKKFNIYYTQLILLSIYLAPIIFGFITQKFFLSIISNNHLSGYLFKNQEKKKMLNKIRIFYWLIIKQYYLHLLISFIFFISKKSF